MWGVGLRILRDEFEATLDVGNLIAGLRFFFCLQNKAKHKTELGSESHQD